MKLILASSSFDSPETVKKCIEFVGKPASDINFAVISEAMSVEYGDHSWFLEDMDSIRNNFGGNIEFVNLLANNLEKVVERIKAADVIFVGGGNTDYLMTVLNKTGLTDRLPELLKDKVYVGSSAGACVLGHRPAYKSFSGYNEDKYIDKYSQIIDLTVLPHFHSKYFTNRNDEWAIDDSKAEDCKVYAISDHSAVVVDDESTYVIGKDYLIILDGNILKRG